MALLAAMDGPLDWLRHGPWLVFTLCFGACVGSFLNVVIYRVPRNMSLANPPSQCPTCSTHLRFFRENLPVLGWLALRGKCRFCKAPISGAYPAVELIMGLLFMGLYALLFMVNAGDAWGWEVAGGWWSKQGFALGWPAYTAMAFLLSGILAMTAIDARTFFLPLSVTLFMSVSGVVLWTIQGALAQHYGTLWPLPGADWAVLCASLAGMGGVLVMTFALHAGWMKPSYADYEAYLPQAEAASDDEASVESSPGAESLRYGVILPCLMALVAVGLMCIGQGAIAAVLLLGSAAWVCLSAFAANGELNLDPPLAADYPHARREACREVLFLLPCVAGVLGGWWLGSQWTAAPAPWLQALGASLWGYLIGGGVVWAVRIAGSIGFGKEAMGMGDVHLMAAVGAVLGWFVPTIAFFVAPFFGLVWAVATWIMGQAGLRERQLPYGPHLCLAVALVVLGRPWVMAGWDALFPMLELPARQLYVEPNEQATGPHSGTDKSSTLVTRLDTGR
ncbi:MAG: prepilin peptidase [Phycisphaerales bacterium]|nr:prepilin peptidase [Phycisphaerales bacterium]